MPRHLTLTIENSPVGIDLIDLLEYEFRKFDSKLLEPMQRKIWVCRWERVRLETCQLLSKSMFDKDIVGSITLSRFLPDDTTREVCDGLGVSEQIGVTVVHSERLAE